MTAPDYIAPSSEHDLCLHGHVMDEANTYVRAGTGRKECRACNREKSRRRRKDPEVRKRENATTRAWGIANREYRLAKQRERNAAAYAERQAIVVAAKDRPCADCEQEFPSCVMDLDHVRGEKVMSVGKMVAAWHISIDDLRAEIAKCEIVCANCHRLRTFGESL